MIRNIIIVFRIIFNKIQSKSNKQIIAYSGNGEPKYQSTQRTQIAVKRQLIYVHGINFSKIKILNAIENYFVLHRFWNNDLVFVKFTAKCVIVITDNFNVCFLNIISYQHVFMDVIKFN